MDVPETTAEPLGTNRLCISLVLERGTRTNSCAEVGSASPSP